MIYLLAIAAAALVLTTAPALLIEWIAGLALRRKYPKPNRPRPD